MSVLFSTQQKNVKTCACYVTRRWDHVLAFGVLDLCWWPRRAWNVGRWSQVCQRYFEGSNDLVIHKKPIADLRQSKL